MTIYAVECGEHIKIGFTAGDPVARLNHLQVGNPVRLRLVAVLWGADLKQERELHDLFADLHTSGEWFRREGALLAWLNACPCPTVPFWTWLCAQEGREDPIGDVAEDAARSYRLYKTIPRFHKPPVGSNTLADWEKYLGGHISCCDEALTALREAFAEWERGV